MWMEGTCCFGCSGEGGGEVGKGIVENLEETSSDGVAQGVWDEEQSERRQDEGLGNSLARVLSKGARVFQVVLDEADASGLLL